MKSIADDCIPKSSCSADAIGTIAFSEFMDPPTQPETVNFTFHHMTGVVRQKDKDFKKVLSLMRTGTLNSDSCDYLINRSLSKIKKRIFDEAIHLVTQCKYSIDPTINYFKMLGTPVAKLIL